LCNKFDVRGDEVGLLRSLVLELTGRLLRVVFCLRFCVRTIQEKSYNLLEHLFPDIDSTVDTIARLDPIHLARGDLPRDSFSAITKLDVEQVAT
jgi:hypothetical protein